MIQPTQDRILVQPIENPEYTKSGIFKGAATTTFVAGREKTRQTTMGKVLAVGPGKYNKKGHRRPPEAPIGSIVAFSDTCGIPIEEGGEKYLFIREGDIAFFMEDVEEVEHVYDTSNDIDWEDAKSKRITQVF